MKRYITNTEDTCWRDSIGCILEVEPRRVPDFVKLYGGRYLDKTREWLGKKYRKGMVYLPSRLFMEAETNIKERIKFNESGGPRGYSIGQVKMIECLDSNHALICYDGKVIWDNGDIRNDEYDVIDGYFVIYDLE